MQSSIPLANYSIPTFNLYELSVDSRVGRLIKENITFTESLDWMEDNPAYKVLRKHENNIFVIATIHNEGVHNG